MKAKINWGILSTARIGVQKVIPAMQKGKHTNIYAIASRKLEKANEVADSLNIEKRYGSYEELLSDPAIDAIYNPLPNNMHVSWTIKAMEAGKHVLCEKPIAMTKEEAEELLDAKKKFPELKVMEAFMYKFHPQWQKVKELVLDGSVGEVKTIDSFFSYYNVDPKNIRNIKETGGGALMDIGCYCISFPRFIFGEEPEKIAGNMQYDPEMMTDVLTSALLGFPSGKTATFTCSTQLMPFQRAHILGNHGHITVEIPVNTPPEKTSRITLQTKEKTESFTFDPIDQYTLQGDAFSKAVIEDKPVPYPLDDAIKNMAVIDHIKLSAKDQKFISF